MTRPAMFVLAEAAPGRLEELAAWYREEHLPEMLSVPGIESAQQYAPTGGNGDAPATLLTIYRFGTDDADVVLTALGARRPSMSTSSALATATVWIAHGINDVTADDTSEGELP